MFQNYKYDSGVQRKQLVCASSNSAADIITQRLLNSGIIKVGDLYRLFSPSAIKQNAPSKKIPEEIKNSKHSPNILYYEKNNTYEVVVPDIETIQSKAIVITTIIAAGRSVVFSLFIYLYCRSGIKDLYHLIY